MKRSKMVHKTRFKRKKSHDHEKNQSKKYNVVYKKYLVREGLYRISILMKMLGADCFLHVAINVLNLSVLSNNSINTLMRNMYL